MFKEGKISLDNIAAAAAAVEAEPVVEEVKTAEKAGGQTGKKHHEDTIFGMLFNFNNETLGDRIKAIAFFFLIFFFVYHYFSTRAINRKFDEYEKKMKVLEDLLNETLKRLQN
jgi:hypothetical protein